MSVLFGNNIIIVNNDNNGYYTYSYLLFFKFTDYLFIVFDLCVSLHNIPSFNPISRGLNILVFGTAMKGVKTIPNIHSINFQQMKNCRCGNRKMFRNELYLFIIAS